MAIHCGPSAVYPSAMTSHMDYIMYFFNQLPTTATRTIDAIQPVICNLLRIVFGKPASKSMESYR